jgi:hypothetical protein
MLSLKCYWNDLWSFPGLSGCFPYALKMFLELYKFTTLACKLVLEKTYTFFKTAFMNCFEKYTDTHGTYWEIIFLHRFIMFSGDYVVE